MILFKLAHVPLILNGTKTQTRRLWIDKKTKKAREKPRCKVGAIHLAKTKMLSKEYFAKLIILNVWKEKLGDISKEDAIKEGFSCTQDFFDIFFDVNDIVTDFWKHHWMEKEIWCVEFEVIEGGGVNE